MTLFKQILGILSIFMIGILSVVMYLNFKTANDFVQNQLYSTANDTATSLGLAISKVANPDDITTIDSMISAIFDKGYYQDITLKNADDEIIIHKNNPKKINGIPDWFINNVELIPATAKSDIMIGWMYFGTIEVISHSGHSYVQLWNTLLDILKSFLVIGSIMIVIFYVLLKFILKSLKDIIAQAKGISNNEFIINKELPFSTEFRSVILAMNSMVEKVKDIFDREASTLKKFNALLYIDKDTNIGNRNSLNQQLKYYLRKTNGIFAIIEIDDALEVKKYIGYSKYLQIIKTFIKEIEEIFIEKEFFIARLDTGTFALILPYVTYKDITKEFSQLAQKMNLIFKKNELDEKIVYGIGITSYTRDEESKLVLSRADRALSYVFGSDYDGYFYYIDNLNGAIKTKDDWIKTLDEAYKNNFIEIKQQHIIDILENDTIKYINFFTRIKDESNNVYFPSDYIHVLKQLGRFDQFEKYNISRILDYFSTQDLKSEIIINLAYEFIIKKENKFWLIDEVKLFSKKSKTKIVFVLLNKIILDDLRYFIEFSNEIKEIGYNIGINNISFERDNYEYLQSIKPKFIAISKTDLILNDEIILSLGSMQNILKAIGVDIIVKHIETNKEKDNFKGNGIRYLQGHFLSPEYVFEN